MLMKSSMMMAKLRINDAVFEGGGGGGEGLMKRIEAVDVIGGGWGFVCVVVLEERGLLIWLWGSVGL